MSQDADGDEQAQMTRRDRQREETRQRVFKAALEIFRRDGVAACRIDDIASLAGVSRGSFYFHFPTKGDVILELLRASELEVSERLAVVPPDTHISDVLTHVASALAEIWEGDPTLLPEVAGVGLKVNSESLADRAQSPLRAALAVRFTDCAARGELVAFLPPEVMADLYLANALGGMLAWCAAQELPLTTVLGGVSTIFLHGAYPRESDGELGGL